MQVQFEKLNGEDNDKIEQMSRLASSIVKEYYDSLLGSEQNDYMIKMFQSVSAIKEQLTHGYIYYFVRVDSENVGFTAFYPRQSDVYVSKLYLRRDVRGQGVGRKMLDFVKEFCRESGKTSIALNVNKYNKSVEIYKKLGFVIESAEKNDIGGGYYMDDYVMRLSF